LGFLLVIFGCGGRAVPGPDANLVTCGTGTQLVDGSCEAVAPPPPTTPSLACGTHTRANGSECEVDATACGPGLVFKGGLCQVPTALPEVGAFLASTSLIEDGDGKVYSTAFGGLAHHIRHVWTD